MQQPWPQALFAITDALETKGRASPKWSRMLLDSVNRQGVSWQPYPQNQNHREKRLTQRSKSKPPHCSLTIERTSVICNSIWRQGAIFATYLQLQRLFHTIESYWANNKYLDDNCVYTKYKKLAIFSANHRPGIPTSINPSLVYSGIRGWVLFMLPEPNNRLPKFPTLSRLWSGFIWSQPKPVDLQPPWGQVLARRTLTVR